MDGNPGFNGSVKPQKNLNVEIGANAQHGPTFWLEAVGFWTFFKDEIIAERTAESHGRELAVNAKESQYRGIELGWRWIPMEGMRVTGAYTHMESKYVRFADQFASGGIVTRIDQSGRQVPAVEKNVLNMKAAYDHAAIGLGAPGSRKLGRQFSSSATTIRWGLRRTCSSTPICIIITARTTIATSSSSRPTLSWTTSSTRPTSPGLNRWPTVSRMRVSKHFGEEWGRAFYAGADAGVLAAGDA
ncbi:MAG: TonB-dependent receptor [Nitrospira sp.]|nr:TonB-dependent receptor [Nitrospira sp.]